MITIDISHDLDRLRKDLTIVQQKQIPFAAAKALTETAKIVRAENRKEMKRVFDRPTRFTLNSLFLKPATKRTLRSIVWLKDNPFSGTPATKYLSPQIEGGRRRLKGFEVLLNKRGVLPNGYYAVPSKKARKDRYGNLSKGLLNQILSYSGAQRDLAQNTKQGRRRQTKAKFVLLDEKNGKPGGLWQLDANQNLFPILIFVKQPHYSERYKFYRFTRRTINANLSTELDKAMVIALRTAK